jgi:short-subunit dehydrogenase
MTADRAARVVVVIGAANGIGAAIATRLASAGARLVLADVDALALERQRMMLADLAQAPLAMHVDVRDPASLTSLCHEATEAFGRVDAVVNCAAVIRPADVASTSPETAREQILVNLVGTVHVTQAFLPGFLWQGRGHLIHLGSLGGIVPMPHEAVYAATKFGVRGFCQSLALELRGTGVHVTVVCPDSADTAQLRAEAGHDPSTLAFTSAPLAPDDVARAVVRALDRPRVEVLVPGARGVLIKLLAFSPRLFAALYPLLDRLGRQGQRRFRAHLARVTEAIP